MLVNRESEQMTFSTKFDALLQSNVAACTEVINTKDISALHTRTQDVSNSSPMDHDPPHWTMQAWHSEQLVPRCSSPFDASFFHGHVTWLEACASIGVGNTAALLVKIPGSAIVEIACGIVRASGHVPCQASSWQLGDVYRDTPHLVHIKHSSRAPLRLSLSKWE